MGLLFNRTPRQAKDAQKAHGRGDALYLYTLPFTDDVNHTEAINAVAAAGWDLHTWHVVHEQAPAGPSVWGLYLFKRIDQP